MLFAALSMIIGGAFYGYIIANLASMMQGLDANAVVLHTVPKVSTQTWVAEDRAGTHCTL